MGKLHWTKVLILIALTLLVRTCYKVEWVEVNNKSIVFAVDSGKVGFIDIDTMVMHPAIYDAISDDECSDGNLPILVNEDGYWGYVDRVSGAYVVPNIFNLMRADSEYKNGYAIIDRIVYQNDAINEATTNSYLFDASGKPVSFPENIEPDSQVDEYGYLAIRNTETGEFGIGRVEGGTASIKIPAIYKAIDFCNGIACLFQDNSSLDYNQSNHETLTIVSIDSGSVYLLVDDFTCVDEEVYYSFSLTDTGTVTFGFFGHTIVDFSVSVE